jgi:hypothetical protein
MFVERRERLIDETMIASLGALMSSTTLVEAEVGETLLGRLTALANRFVDGVLTLTGLKADRIETSELCVDGVCVDADDLRRLLEQGSSAAPTPVPSTPGGSAVITDGIESVVEPETTVIGDTDVPPESVASVSTSSVTGEADLVASTTEPENIVELVEEVANSSEPAVPVTVEIEAEAEPITEVEEVADTEAAPVETALAVAEPAVAPSE